jgi:tetratricopeptide (TPR) repeat protein
LVIDAAGSTAAIQHHALLVRAEIQRRLARLDLAMNDCEEAIRRDPASARAFELRGRVRTDAKQYERALDDFDQAIRLDKDLASAFAGRAAAFALMRQHRLAVRDYTEAVRLDPRNTQLLADRAAEYSKVRRIDLAIDDCTTAIGLEPKVAEHHASRGRLYLRNNAYARSIADLDEAIRLEPRATYYFDRGNAYSLKGDQRRAIADSTKRSGSTGLSRLPITTAAWPGKFSVTGRGRWRISRPQSSYSQILKSLFCTARKWRASGPVRGATQTGS